MFQEEIDRVRVSRSRLADAKAKLEAYLNENDDLKRLQNDVAAWKQDTEAAEAELRIVALAAYRQDQNKHPCTGVEIKVTMACEVQAPDDARAWAFGNLPKALVLDEKVVSEYAKKFGDVPGVKVFDQPKVYLARDL